jgi:aminopeptidase N
LIPWVLLAWALVSDASAGQVTTPAARAFDFLHYEARLEPDIAAKTLRGQVSITLVATSDTQEAITLDCGNLTIDAVRERDQTREFAHEGRRLNIRFPGGVRAGERRQIDITYHGAPRFGLEFFPERSQIFTIFSTSQWLVAVDAPEERATLDLSLVVPRGWKVVANGREVGRRDLTKESVLHRWRIDRPVPSYTFGFAAGPFREVKERHGKVSLRYLADPVMSEAELRRVFRASGDMLRFFEERAGVPYPDAEYSQALVARTVGQEMSGFSLMSEAYGRAVLEDSGDSGLIAHELSHQWWGNLVTCRDYAHFWLNEGFATFMAAAFRERQSGREAYLRVIEASRVRYQKVRDAGHDKPLVFPDWDRPTADDRTLVYHKGAYVLHLLREELGDAAFWKAIRDYTRAYVGRSVTTMDFQAAIERSSGRDLSAFFKQWAGTSR